MLARFQCQRFVVPVEAVEDQPFQIGFLLLLLNLAHLLIQLLP